MPVASSKINPQELEAVTEYANRHGITVSHLIRMLLIREVAAPRIVTSFAEEKSIAENENKIVAERTKAKTLLERIRESRLQRTKDDRTA